MKKIIEVMMVALAIFAAASPSLAHHNANAQYDNSRRTTVTGALIEMRDIQPHAQWKVSVPGPNGAATVYNFEAQGGASLRRAGISVKTDLKAGQTYTYIFSPARDGSPTGFLSDIIINDKKYTIAVF